MQLNFPPLVFGSTSLGNLFRVVSDRDKAQIVAAWVGTGLSPLIIDSAGKYGAGLSLEVIGRELKRLNIPTQDVIISNKLGWRRVGLTSDEPTFEPGAWFGLQHDAVQDISYDGILRCYEEGLELLGGYPTQLVSVHDPDEYLAAAENDEDRRRRLDDILAAYDALHQLKRDGRVAAVGIGAKHWQTVQEISQVVELDWAMFANSLTIMRHPSDLIQFIDELSHQGVQVINSALFHGGFLLGGEFFDYYKLNPNEQADRDKLNWRKQFQLLCQEHEVNPFDAGVAFGRAHPGVRSVALATSRADRVESHLLALESKIPIDFWSACRQAALIHPHCDFVPGH